MAKKCVYFALRLDKNIPCDFIKLKEIKKEDIFSFLVFFLQGHGPICARFSWNWPSSSWEDVQISSMYFSQFHYYLPLHKDMALHLNNLESPLLKHLCVNIGFNWQSGSWEIISFIKTFFTFKDYILEH